MPKQRENGSQYELSMDPRGKISSPEGEEIGVDCIDLPESMPV
jgi:hypothetical protein